MKRRSIGLTIPIPCLRGYFGDRLHVFQALVSPKDITGLLGHDPRSKNWNSLPKELVEMYGHLQRKTSKSRRASLGRYIEERILGNLMTVGAFPALAIGMTLPATFEPDEPNSPVGTLEFDVSSRVRRVLLDGLGRVTAALDLLETRAELGERMTFMVSIFAPTPAKGELTTEELGQLFHDFNFLVEPISKGQAVDLDQSNLYIALTNLLAKEPAIRDNGGMEPRAASLGKKSTALVAKQVLLKFVKAACEGHGKHVSTLRHAPLDGNLTSTNIGEYRDRIAFFLTHIADTMGEKFRDRDSVLLSASGWGALGLLFFDIDHHLSGRLSTEEQSLVFTQIGSINWSRYNQDWIDYLGGTDKDADGKARLGKVFGGRAIERVQDYVHRNTILGELLRERAELTQESDELVPLTA